MCEPFLDHDAGEISYANMLNKGTLVVNIVNIVNIVTIGEKRSSREVLLVSQQCIEERAKTALRRHTRF